MQQGILRSPRELWKDHKTALRSQHVDFTSYEGPTSIQTFLLYTCQSWVSEFERVLQQQVAKNDELQAFIKQLEAAYDQTVTDTDVQHGDEIVEEIQQFLRQRHRPGTQPPSSDEPS